MVGCNHSRFLEHRLMADNCVDIRCESITAVLKGHGRATNQVDARLDVAHLQPLVDFGQE